MHTTAVCHWVWWGWSVGGEIRNKTATLIMLKLDGCTMDSILVVFSVFVCVCNFFNKRFLKVIKCWKWLFKKELNQHRQLFTMPCSLLSTNTKRPNDGAFTHGPWDVHNLYRYDCAAGSLACLVNIYAKVIILIASASATQPSPGEFQPWVQTWEGQVFIFIN